MGEYFTTDQVAARYHKSKETIRYWRHIGYGPKGVKVGTSILYPDTEIEKFDKELLAQVDQDA